MASASVFDVDVELRARYRCDVSPLEAVPAGVARARDVADVIAAIDEARGQGVGLLPVGAQTSTTGASVAVHGGLIVDLSALDSAPILDSESMTVRVRPGTRVGALRHWLKERGFDMPVDPTSQHECTVGGAIATNASGPATFAHGSMRDWVVGLDVVDGQSERHEFRRPSVRKRAMGPAALQDPIDFIVGSEGLFGVVVEAELAIRRSCETTMGLWIPFRCRTDLFAAVRALVQSAIVGVRAIEWLDGRCCALLDGQGDGGIHPEDGGGLYVEVEGAATVVEEAAERIAAVTADHRADPSTIQVYATAEQRRRFEDRRHTVPDTLNRRGRTFSGQGGGKLSTDWSAPLGALPGLFATIDERLGALSMDGWYAYGHIGNGHPHLNLIVRNDAEKSAAVATLAEQLRDVVASGGVPVSEHGIGKVKRELVAPFLSPATDAAIRAVKAHFDPAGILARGNVIA